MDSNVFLSAGRCSFTSQIISLKLSEWRPRFRYER